MRDPPSQALGPAQVRLQSESAKKRAFDDAAYARENASRELQTAQAESAAAAPALQAQLHAKAYRTVERSAEVNETLVAVWQTWGPVRVASVPWADPLHASCC